MQIWKGHTWQLQKMGKQNASWKEAKIANGGRIERVNATWKGAHLTNEHMQGTNASWKEATWYVENIHRWNATREKGKCQMQHTWKQQINLDKVVKPAQKTKETLLNLKREVRGEPVKPKKNAQCWGSCLPSGQVAGQKGSSPIRIGDLQSWILFVGNRNKLM